jgi:hypothetical protein
LDEGLRENKKYWKDEEKDVSSYRMTKGEEMIL